MSHIERMKNELVELREKETKLEAFIEGNAMFNQLGETDQALLVAQLSAMSAYSTILAARIKRS